MGWRDTQAAVQSGELSFAPNDDFGQAFASAADIIAEKWMTDAADAKTKKLAAEKAAKDERDQLEEDRKAAEAEDRNNRKTAKAALAVARVPWSQDVENHAFQMIQGGSTQLQVSEFFSEGIKSGDIVVDAPELQGPMPGVAPTSNVLTKYESGSGGADALLNQAQTDEFSNISVSTMTMAELMKFQQARGAGSYHNYAKANMPAGTEAAKKGLGSTPVGKYQFVGDTLKDLKKRGILDELGITDETVFDEKTQDAIFVRYAQERLQLADTPEGRRAEIRKVWEGLRKASDSEVDEVIAQVETGLFDGKAAVSSNRTDAIQPGESIDIVYASKANAGETKKFNFKVDENGLLKFGSRTFDTTTDEYNTMAKIEAAVKEYNDEMNPDYTSVVQRTPNEAIVEAERTDEMDGGLMIFPQTVAGLDIDEYINAIDAPTDMAKQIARIDNNNVMSEAEKEDAKTRIRKYVTNLPSSKMANEDLAKLEEDELWSLLALVQAEVDATPEGEISPKSALLKRVQTALDGKIEPFDINDYDDVKNPTIQTRIDNKATPEDERIQLQALLVNRKANKPFKLLQGSPSFITTYQEMNDEGNPVGDPQVTTTMLTDGDPPQHVDLSTGQAVVPVGQPQNREELRELASDFAKINNSLLKPLKVARTNMVLAVQSAKNLSDIVTRTPSVQTTIGGKFPRLLKRIGIEIEAADELFFGGANAQEFEAHLNSTLLSENVQGAARDQALYEAELYKFAFTYASSRLGQSGQGLSNKDFEKALAIVAAGTGQGFIDGLKGKVSEIIKISDDAIMNLKEDGSAIIMNTLDTSGKLMAGYQRTSEEYANQRGYGEAFAWAKGTPADGGGGFKTVTQAMVDGSSLITPAMLGKKIKIVRRNGQTTVVVEGE
jgi:muramidase (phage lysozyme)